MIRRVSISVHDLIWSLSRAVRRSYVTLICEIFLDIDLESIPHIDVETKDYPENIQDFGTVYK